MEAVKPLDENPEDLKLREDTRTDLEELADLAEELRTYRRKITKLATEEMKLAFKGQKRSEDKSGEIAELWKFYKYLENSYVSLNKICFPKGKTQGNGNNGTTPDMGKVKGMTGSMGEIVRKID